MLRVLQLCATSLTCANAAGTVKTGLTCRAQVVYNHTVSINLADSMCIYQPLHADIAEGWLPSLCLLLRNGYQRDPHITNSDCQ
jgi:hypothetical protein